MTNNEGLKPCPFCGKSVKLIKYTTFVGKEFYYIRHSCGDGTSTHAGTAIRTKRNAIAAWNKRIEETKNERIRRNRKSP